MTIEPNEEKFMPGVQVTRYEVETLYRAMLSDLAGRQASAECFTDDSLKRWDRQFLWERLEMLALHLGYDLISDYEPLYREKYKKSHMARMSTGGAAPKSTTTKPNCPKCNTNEHVIKGAEQHDDCWVCWKKNGGCGAMWPVAEPWSKPDRPAAIPGVTTADRP